MKRTIFKALLASTLSVLFSHSVFSDDATAVIATVETHQLPERFPLKSIDRPGTMPTGIIQIDTRLKMTGLKTVNLSADTKFGIVEKVQGEFGYDGLDFNTSEEKKFEAKPTVNLGAKYSYYSIPHVSFSATAKLPIHVADGEIVRDFTIGLPVVFYNEIMAGSILGDLIQVTMRNKQGVKFDFPFWYGVQVYGNLWAMVFSSFGNVAFQDDKWTGLPFWKKFPLELEASYAFNHYFDLGAHFGFDDLLNKPKEHMKFGLIFTIRAGQLFG